MKLTQNDLLLNIVCLMIIIAVGTAVITYKGKPSKKVKPQVKRKSYEQAQIDQAKIIKYITACEKPAELDRVLAMLFNFRVNYTGVLSEKEIDDVSITATEYTKEARLHLLAKKSGVLCTNVS